MWGAGQARGPQAEVTLPPLLPFRKGKREVTASPPCAGGWWGGGLGGQAGVSRGAAPNLGSSHDPGMLLTARGPCVEARGETGGHVPARTRTRTRTRAHACPWMPMCAHGCPQVPTRAHGCPHVPMCVHRCPRVPMGAHGCPWVPTCAHRCPRMPMCAHGCPRVPTRAHGCPRAPTGAHACPPRRQLSPAISPTFICCFYNGGRVRLSEGPRDSRVLDTQAVRPPPLCRDSVQATRATAMAEGKGVGGRVGGVASRWVCMGDGPFCIPSWPPELPPGPAPVQPRGTGLGGRPGVPVPPPAPLPRSLWQQRSGGQAPPAWASPHRGSLRGAGGSWRLGRGGGGCGGGTICPRGSHPGIPTPC